MKMLQEQITAGLQYTWSKNQHGSSALLNSIIQLSQYYEERALFCSQGLLLLPAPPRALWRPPPQTHTHKVEYFLCFLIASMHCVGVWGTIHFSQRTQPHRHAENGCGDTHNLTHEVMHTNTRKTLVCHKLTSSQLLQACLCVSVARSTFFNSIPHRHHLIFHQRGISSNVIH